MLTDIIIIIPTHKRQHYLNRVAWYYSHFDMQVYICDSTPGTSFNIDKYDNVNYIWCPEKNFYTKILHVLNTTNADFYATSPDDDFLKQETLMECYESMKEDSSYSMAVGKQAFFKENFKDDYFNTNVYANGLQGLSLHGSVLSNTIKFWSNYQNVLWTLFRKDMLIHAFELLVKQNYSSQNFIELTIGMSALVHGNIYVSKDYLNLRELIEGEHWGKAEVVISLSNYFKYNAMKSDIHKLWNLPKHHVVHRLGICLYLVFGNKYIMAATRISRRMLQGDKIKEKFRDETISLIKEALRYVKL